MIYTTLNKIRNADPCSEEWVKLLRHLNKTMADDEPLSLLTILNSNGLDDALWCLIAVDSHQREMRLYAVWCARQVQHLINDSRSLAALDMAEQRAYGNCTDHELSAAIEAASEAASEATSEATWEAARAAQTAVASDAASAAAIEAAWIAAWAAASEAASKEARAAAWDAAWEAARVAQTAEFLRVFCVAEAKA